MWGSVVKYAVKGAIAFGLKEKALGWVKGWIKRKTEKSAEKIQAKIEKVNVQANKKLIEIAKLADDLGLEFGVTDDNQLLVFTKEEAQAAPTLKGD